MPALTFPPCVLPASARALRRRVRRFLQAELRGQGPLARAASWDGFDPEFSRRMGAAGFIGVAVPREYGGRGGSALDRYVVLEEALVAGAPTGFHWFADRQSAPLILRYGSEAQKRALLPGICRGELCFAIGMSEAGAGSDLAALRTTARSAGGGFRVNGSKLWSTHAHRADYLIALFRTGDDAAGRHQGLTHFLVDLRRTPGVTLRPIRDMAGREHFSEVIFEDAPLPADSVIGTVGEGWQQVRAELALERSGPERYLSCHVLFCELLAALRGERSDRARVALGEAVAQLVTLRCLSLSVAGMLAAGEDPGLGAAVVKDLGAAFEQSLPALAQELTGLEPDAGPGAAPFQQLLAAMTLQAPSFALRGGTVEILRGIVARGLGLG